MFVRTCIFVRSCAIVKRTGAWNDAATVWPTSYCRLTTTPSIGDAIRVYERFVSACFSAACACATAAAAESRVVCARVEVGLREELLREQVLRARERDLGVPELHLRLLEIRAPLVDGLLERRRVELGEELPLLHRRIEVDVELRDDAGDLAAHLARS